MCVSEATNATARGHAALHDDLASEGPKSRAFGAFSAGFFGGGPFGLLGFVASEGPKPRAKALAFFAGHLGFRVL